MHKARGNRALALVGQCQASGRGCGGTRPSSRLQCATSSALATGAGSAIAVGSSLGSAVSEVRQVTGAAVVSPVGLSILSLSGRVFKKPKGRASTLYATVRSSPKQSARV